MSQLSDSEIYEGIKVNLTFQGELPMFGDLFAISGSENPNFPSSRKFPFDKFEALQFSQVDDYFGIKTFSGEGDDVAVWLYPTIDNTVVDHNIGPFEGLRLSYCVLRNPIERADHFYFVITTLLSNLDVSSDLSLTAIKSKVSSIHDYWRKQGVELGSEQALQIEI